MVVLTAYTEQEFLCYFASFALKIAKDFTPALNTIAFGSS